MRSSKWVVVVMAAVILALLVGCGEPGDDAPTAEAENDNAAPVETQATSEPETGGGDAEATEPPLMETLTPAAAGRFEGRVYWQGLNAPVAGASVSLAPMGSDGAARQGTTDADGRFVIEDVPPGTYQLLVSASGALAEPAACTNIGVDFSRRPDALEDASSMATLLNGAFDLQAESPGGYVLAPGGSITVDLVLTCS